MAEIDSLVLANRLLKQLRHLKQTEDPVFLGGLTVSPEELEHIRQAFGPWMSGRSEPAAEEFIQILRESGFYSLVCFLFAKYGPLTDRKYWVSLADWAGTSARGHDLHKYDLLRRFYDDWGLHLLESGRGTHLYVGTQYFHAIVPASRSPCVFRFLKELVLSCPYSLEPDEVSNLLRETLDDVARLLGVATGDEEDEEDERIITGVADTKQSLYLLLPRFLPRAYSVDRRHVTGVLTPLYRRVENIVLSHLNPYRIETALPPLEYQLQSSLEECRVDLTADLLPKTRGPAPRSVYSTKFRTPYYRLDLQHHRLVLVVPEQRLDYVAQPGELSIRVQGPRGATIVPLEARDHRRIWTITPVEELVLATWCPELSIELAQGTRILKTFPPLSGSLWFFDQAGEPLTLPITRPQTVYVLVGFGTDFDADRAALAFQDDARTFEVYLVDLDATGFVMVDNRLIGALAERVPQAGYSRVALVSGAHLEEPEGDPVPIFRELPEFHFRYKSVVDIESQVPLIIDGDRIAYHVIERRTLADGSGEEFYLAEVKADAWGTWLGRTLDWQLGFEPLLRFRLALFPGFEFDFTKPTYTNDRAVRVHHLSFQGSAELLAGDYRFPKTDMNTKFKVGRFGAKVVLAPPVVTWVLDNEVSLDTHVHIAALAGRKLQVQHGDLRIEGLFRTSWEATERRLPVLEHKAGRTVFALDTLNNLGPEVEQFQLLVQVQNLDTSPSEFVICAVHRRPCVLDGVTPVFITPGHLLRKLYAHEGLYLDFRMVADPRQKYRGRLVSRRDQSTLGTFGLDPLEKQHYFGPEEPVSGTYVLEVDQEVYRMGRPADILPAFSFEVDIKSSQVHIPKELQALDRQVIDCHTFVTRRLEGKNVVLSKYSVRNLFFELRVTKSDNTPILEGIAYFLREGTRHYHTRFNPYRVAITKSEGRDIEFSVVDREGNPMKFDEMGHGNPLNFVGQLRTARLVLGQISDTPGRIS